MPTPAVLRRASRRARQVANAECCIHLKRALAGHALALAQLAEKIERDGIGGYSALIGVARRALPITLLDEAIE